LIDFKYYQPPKPKRDPKEPNLMSYFPVYPANQLIQPQYGYQNPPMIAQPLPPIIKTYNIQTNGPMDDHKALTIIYEDYLPSKITVESLSSVSERLQLYKFIRSSIFSNEDGKNIDIDSSSTNSLLSYIKFDELNPYNTYDLSNNPYKGLPEGFMIFRSCYPIRKDLQASSVMCAKDSTSVNIRIYRMVDGSVNIFRTAASSIYQFDEWRDIAFYEYVRENIIKRNISPNFTCIYGYFISENATIDFDELEKIKGKTTTTQPKYIQINQSSKTVVNNSVFMQQTNNQNPQPFQSLPALPMFGSSNIQPITTLVGSAPPQLQQINIGAISSIDPSKLQLNRPQNGGGKMLQQKITQPIRQSAGNSTNLLHNQNIQPIRQSVGNSTNPLQNQNIQPIRQSVGNSTNPLHNQNIQPIRQSVGNSTNPLQNQNIQPIRQSAGNSTNPLHNQNIQSIRQSVGNSTNPLQNQNIQSIRQSVGNSTNPLQNPNIRPIIQSAGQGTQSQQPQSQQQPQQQPQQQVIINNPNAYLGAAMVTLTESSTYNLYRWASKTYELEGNIKRMINPGIHTDNEWMNVLFQTISALYVCQLHQIIINNFSLRNNCMIKDMNLKGQAKKFWKYIINDIEYYIPNLGYLILLDTNFRDVDEQPTTLATKIQNKKQFYTNTHKIDGKIVGTQLTDAEINDKVFEMFIDAINPSKMKQVSPSDGFVLPGSEIMNLLGDMYREAVSDGQKSIEPYIIKYMKQFLNNRIGTELTETDVGTGAANIIKTGNKLFSRGQILTYYDNNKYTFVMFLSVTQGNVTIITKDNSTFVEKTVPHTSLYAYGGKIIQNIKPTEPTMVDDDMIEQYVIKT